LIPSLTIFGAHSSGGQLATLTLVVAGRVKLLAPPTDKSPDPIPLIVVMVIATVYAAMYALAVKLVDSK